MELISDSIQKTAEIASELGQKLKMGDIVAFFGPMGSGKTYFIKGLAKSLNFKGEVTSPTFNIVNEYETAALKLYHFDFYRIQNPRELTNIGFEDYLFGEGICLMEWAEKVEHFLPRSIWKVYIKISGDSERRIKIIRGR